MIECTWYSLWQSLRQYPLDTAFVIYHRYCWSLLNSLTLTIGKATSIFSKVVTGNCSHLESTLTIGPENARGPCVNPSRCYIKWRRRNSLPWSWHTSQCIGSDSSNRITPTFFFQFWHSCQRIQVPLIYLPRCFFWLWSEVYYAPGYCFCSARSWRHVTEIRRTRLRSNNKCSTVIILR